MTRQGLILLAIAGALGVIVGFGGTVAVGAMFDGESERSADLAELTLPTERRAVRDVATLDCQHAVLPHVVDSISETPGRGVDSPIMVLGGDTPEFRIYQQLTKEYIGRAFREGVANVMPELIADLERLCKNALAAGSSNTSSPSTEDAPTPRVKEAPTACPRPEDPFPEGCELTSSIASSIVEGMGEAGFESFGFDFDPDDPAAVQSCGFPEPAVPGEEISCQYQLPDGRMIIVTGRITENEWFELLNVEESGSPAG